MTDGGTAVLRELEGVRGEPRSHREDESHQVQSRKLFVIRAHEHSDSLHVDYSSCISFLEQDGDLKVEHRGAAATARDL